MDNEHLDFDEQHERCREKLLILKGPGGVSLSIAQFFIKHSAYWDHPSAGLVNTPKHANNITHGRFGHQLRFGGNLFLIETAIKRCVYTVGVQLDSFEDGDVCSNVRLVQKLKLCVRGAVANNDGNEYSGYYPATGNYMMFGTQAINLQDFIGIVTATSEVGRMYKFL